MALLCVKQRPGAGAWWTNAQFNITSLVGREPDLVHDVEKYLLQFIAYALSLLAVRWGFSPKDGKWMSQSIDGFIICLSHIYSIFWQQCNNVD